MTEGSPGGPSGQRTALSYVGLGFEIVVPLLLGLFGGRWLDRKLDTEPWLLIAGAVLGMGAGFVNFLRAVQGTRGARRPP